MDLRLARHPMITGMWPRCLWSCGCTAVLAMAVPAQAQFSVNPVIIQFTATAPQTEVVQLVNEGTEEMRFRVYAGDFDQTESGDHEFLALGDHPRSCGDRLKFFPDAVTLRPGERQDIRIELGRVSQTCWSLVFMESSSITTTGMYASQRIGVKVYGVPLSAAAEGEITSVTVDREGSELDVALEFRSGGEAPLRPEGRVEIRTFTGEVVTTAAVESFSVLPGYARRTAVRIDRPLPPGRYLAVPILDFGGEYLAGGQAAFQVP